MVKIRGTQIVLCSLRFGEESNSEDYRGKVSYKGGIM